MVVYSCAVWIPGYITCLGYMFWLFSILVSGAKLQGHGGVFQSKPDLFAEVSVDGQTPRKTEVQKKTQNPTWNEDFTV